MKRWLWMMTMCVAVTAASSAALAQGVGNSAATPRDAALAQNMGAPPTPAPRDTARVGYHYIYLIRHAWYDGSDPRDERIGKGIDSLGRVQSKLLAARLATWPFRPDRLVSSTFTRARETADIIGEALHMPAVRDSDISECTFPSNRPDYMRNLAPGEADSCLAAIQRAWPRYFTPVAGRDDQHDVLVAHGNVIRWLVSKSLGMDTLRWPEFDIGNCSITTIVVRPDGTTRLATFSDTGHLPASTQTWTGRGAGWSPPSPRRAPASGARGVITSPPPGRGVSAPAPAAAYDTLRHVRPAPGNR